MTRGLGAYQQEPSVRTLGKIIFILCKEGPLTKYKISLLTGIHRAGKGDRTNILDKVLNKQMRNGSIYKYSTTTTDTYRSYFLANWSHPLTKDTFYFYRNTYRDDYYYFTEAGDLDDEINNDINFDMPSLPSSNLEILLRLQIDDLLYAFSKKKRKHSELYKDENKELAKALAEASRNYDSVNTNDGGMLLQPQRIEIKTRFRDVLLQVCKLLGANITVSTDRKEYMKKKMFRLDRLGNLQRRSNIYVMNEYSKIIESVNSRREELRKEFGDRPEILKLAPFDILIQMKLENKLDRTTLDYISIWKALDRAGLLEFTKSYQHQ